MYAFGSGERKGMFCLSNTGWMSEIIEKIGEWVWILKRTCVNPALDCCAETACIYICRGSRCFEHTIDKTEQLIIPKYSRRATDDPCRTCCHRGCAGVNQAARQNLRASISLNLLCLLQLSLYSTEITHQMFCFTQMQSTGAKTLPDFFLDIFYLNSSTCTG